MTPEEWQAQAEVRDVVESLKGIGSRLRSIAATLPRSPQEALMYAGEEDPDVATEVRSVIECVLADQIDAAVRDLTAAAEYRGNERKER
jgi:hypothetical protein